MSGAMGTLAVVAACLCAGVAAGSAVLMWLSRRARAKRRAVALGVQKEADADGVFSEKRDWVLAYAERLTRRLFTDATEPITPSVRARRAGETLSRKS